MKIQSIIIFLFFIVSRLGFSQNHLPEFTNTKDSLININSNLIIDYHLSLGGMFVPEIEKDCSEIEPRYLFWISNDRFYKQKFTECKKHPWIEMPHSELLSTIINNLNVIQQTEILPVQSEEIIQIEVTHDDEWNFIIYTPNVSFTKIISRFDLETKNISDNELNINYESNQKSIIKKLITLAHKEAY